MTLNQLIMYTNIEISMSNRFEDKQQKLLEIKSLNNNTSLIVFLCFLLSITRLSRRWRFFAAIP